MEDYGQEGTVFHYTRIKPLIEKIHQSYIPYGIPDDRFMKKIENLLFSKYKDFKDENEYRIVKIQEPGSEIIDEDFIDITDCIKAVFIS